MDDVTELSITVTELTQFCHRRGDIDQRFKPSPTGVQGVAGHQRVYTRRQASYQREYAVEYQHTEPGLILTLRGRADGYDPEVGLVEEIKTCRVPPDTISEPVAQLHRAQGRLYAAIIAAQELPSHLDVRVTWFNIDSGEEFNRTETYTKEALAEFLDATLSQFAEWLRKLARARRARDASLAELAFPYGEFRDGQRDIAELSYKCIDQGGHLLLEAPTGSGKTSAVLFPALKAMATDKHDKVVFLTSKTVGRRAAENTLADLAAAGYRGTALSLTAKDKICLSPGRACHGDDCPYARDYYEKLPAAMFAAIEQGTLRRGDIESLAQTFEVCPYELTIDLLPWVDVIVADLHYVYSLTATLSACMESDNKRWTVLLDEAHNLPGRARDMYSAGLEKAALMRAKTHVSGNMAKALSRLNRQLLALQNASWQEAEFDSSESLPPDLIAALRSFVSTVSEELAQDPIFLHRHPELMTFYFEVLQFLRVADQWGDDYRFQLSRGAGRQSLRVKLNCLDPSRQLAARQQRAHSVIAFSATLSPLPWSKASLGLENGAVCSRANSPFDSEQLQVWLATDIDTRFRQRDTTLPKLARQLQRWLAGTPGNCILYFPSYRYLQDCLAQMQSAGASPESRTLWVQHAQQSEGEREELLQLLAERRDMAAFCILGGVFGEGIDLPGEQLSSVVVVGIGMPQVNRDTRLLKDWHQQRHNAGFEYAFMYPGMQKVDQALGRVVRRLQDTGSALLIDPRYGEKQYRALLPPWWEYKPWPQS